MKLIEIPGLAGTRRFINLNRVITLSLGKNGEIMLEPMMEVMEKKHPSYKELLQIMGIKEKPASQVGEWEEEKGKISGGERL